MKGGFAAAVLAALAGGVSAAHHRHGHDNLFAKRGNETGEVCVPGCTTIWTTITGAPTRTSSLLAAPFTQAGEWDRP